eukprot:COSAG02_NODE_23472_length_717_cov_2.254045_2_plen_114_part_01
MAATARKNAALAQLVPRARQGGCASRAPSQERLQTKRRRSAKYAQLVVPLLRTARLVRSAVEPRTLATASHVPTAVLQASSTVVEHLALLVPRAQGLMQTGRSAPAVLGRRTPP